MKPIPTTPLENHIAQKIGVRSGQPLQVESLTEWQLNKINEIIDYARKHSIFYRKRFAGISNNPLSDLSDLCNLQFTTSKDIENDPMRFLCVSQDQIARVVTIQTSGTTHTPKRLFFTESDLELTIDFFRYGMSTLVKPDQKVLILMPGKLPGSVGDLLTKGLAGINVTGIVHGPVKDPKSALDQVMEHDIDCLVGIPVQVLSMARHEMGVEIGKGRIKSVLLSTDYIPRAIVFELRRVWGCDVFQHYGMTEMGLGGGVECRAFDGYHLREADLYFEIINPETGEPVSEEQQGEVVFTTLTRDGMPLIRYRTGDRARFIVSPCPCKSVIRRMEPVSGRIEHVIRLKNDSELTMSLLDEAVFSVPGLQNYQVTITRKEQCDFLEISVNAGENNSTSIAVHVRKAVMNIPQLSEAFNRGLLAVSNITLTPQDWFTTGVGKRRITERKGY